MSEPPEQKRPIVEPSAKDAGAADGTWRALRLRVRQQEILAELGVLALQGASFPELLEQTARLTAEGLAAEFSKVLEYLPAEKQLLVRAGVGWGNGVVGSAKLPADVGSPAGFALRTGRPVISNHLENEQRFKTPALLARYGIRRAMNVILQGDGSPFGVLEVDARSGDDFTENDIAFLQGAANILGMAIERQRHERRLEAALERQQILLKEINHRVKNSLQLVASMLNLQAGNGSDQELRRRLLEASGRVLAIARAHDRLYRNEQIGMLDFGDYLREVCRDLDLAVSGCSIEMSFADDVWLATDRAIPLALIATELITNAAKYAYPCDEKGKVRVGLAKQGEDRIVLSVSDDGVGLPFGFDIRTAKGLGMRIVRAFAEQLGALLTVRAGNPGAEFALIVPRDRHPP